ncbi:MAG: hypothetical protein KDE14_15615 [Rhodobacteraceae bacterium]|nr:hypothetical protein [Paracoccaceae bacterium]
MADNKRTDRPTYAADFIKGDTDSAVFLGNAHIDNLMTVVIALGSEIWADRQRLRIVEKLLSSKGKVTTEMVEQYVPTEEEKAAWQAEREAMVKRVYAVLARDTSKARPFGEERQFN